MQIWDIPRIMGDFCPELFPKIELWEGRVKFGRLLEWMKLCTNPFKWPVCPIKWVQEWLLSMAVTQEHKKLPYQTGQSNSRISGWRSLWSLEIPGTESGTSCVQSRCSRTELWPFPLLCKNTRVWLLGHPNLVQSASGSQAARCFRKLSSIAWR